MRTLSMRILSSIFVATLISSSAIAQTTASQQFYRQMAEAYSAGDYDTVRMHAENLAALDQPRRSQYEAIITSLDSNNTAEVASLIAEVALSMVNSAPAPMVGAPSEPSTTESSSVASEPESPLNTTAFNKLEEGMNYSEVVRILGSEGDRVSHSTVLGTTRSTYQWKDGSRTVSASFTNDSLINMWQVGLR